MPQALKPLCLIQFWGWKNSLFPILALWGNKNWHPSMKVKKMDKFGNKSGLMGWKWSSLIAPGARKILCLILFWGWVNSLFPILALWGNKNSPPCMKVKKLEKSGNKSGLMGCKWSSLIAQGAEDPLSHPFLELRNSHFSQNWSSGVIRIGIPVWKWKRWINLETKVA